MANLPQLPHDRDFQAFMQRFVTDWLAQYVANVLNLYEGDGVPTLMAPEGSLYRRRDAGELYVREGGAWVLK